MTAAEVTVLVLATVVMVAVAVYFALAARVYGRMTARLREVRNPDYRWTAVWSAFLLAGAVLVLWGAAALWGSR